MSNKTFTLLAKICRHQSVRRLLIKRFKAAFFSSFRSDPQQTLNILAASLSSSQEPAWSMQLLELLASLPNASLEANRFIVMCFKPFPEDREPVIHYVLRAQSVLMSCFAIHSLDIKQSLIDYSDRISFTSKDQRPLAMSDLSVERESILGEWFIEHKLTARMVNQDQSGFFNLAKGGAEAGDSKSQYILGMIYSDGFGPVQKDAEQALYWLKASAGQRFAHAQCTIGYMLCLGTGVAQDTLEGKIWLDAAARNGSKVAKWAKCQQVV